MREVAFAVHRNLLTGVVRALVALLSLAAVLLLALHARAEAGCRTDADCVLDYSVALTNPRDPCSCPRCGRHLPRAVSKALAPKPPSRPCAPRPCPACLVHPPPPLRAVCESGRCKVSDVKRPAASRPFHGNTRSKVFHRTGCKDYDCKHCTAGFRTRDEAIRAGFRPHAECASEAARTPWSQDRVCKADADCVLLPIRSPCACSPCGRVQAQAANRKALAALRASWAQQRCKVPMCPACAPLVIGDKALCLSGQCQAR